jgi:NAD(P)-dependent dehydrogenase (short-subunit alcohol dehydrogenase family)
MGALDGKVAIVTGAGQGVGRCHAELLAAEGAAVVVNDLTEKAGDTVAAIASAGGRAAAHRGSVCDWEAAAAMVAVAVDAFGGLDILVTNAGMMRDAMSFSMTEEQFDSVVDVHLKGTFAPIHHAVAWWREQAKAAGEGAALPGRRIITTTSESGLFGGPGQSNYGSAKGGIASMTMILAKELQRYNVTANCIAPRARTQMTEVNPRFAKPESGFDRYDPAHVSPFVAWLASDAAAEISGQFFVVTGDQIHRIQPYAVAASIFAGEQRWTLDAITEHVGELFAGAPTRIAAWAGPAL